MSLTRKMTGQKYHRENAAISAELVYLLYSQAKPAIFGSFFVATVLVYALYHQLSDRLLFFWFGLMGFITALRYCLIQLYLQKNAIVENYRIWKRYFVAVTALTGICWSYAGVVLVPAVSSSYQALITCSLAGVSAGALPFFSGSRLVSFSFAIPLLLPFSISLLMQDSIALKLLGGLTSLYLLLLLISASRTHKAIYSAVKLKYENMELLKSQLEAKSEVDAINRELNNEIQERRQAEKLLKKSEEQYRLVTDALPVLISYIDRDMHFQFNNKAFSEWFNKPLSEISGKHVKDVLGSIAYSIFAEYSEKLSAKKQVTYETILQSSHEEERYVSVTLIPHIEDDVVKGTFSLISDMTPRINYLATHDALTDLPNRSLFTARFSHALKRAHRENNKLALLFLDLDHFKKVNDTLGHDVGDHLLIKVSERIRECLREGDTLSRLGGDEFTVLLEDVNNEDVVRIAETLKNSFGISFKLGNRDVFITTSIGISVYPDDGIEMQMLLKNADMAIYRAKEHGRNTFEFYTNEMNERILKKSTIETSLRSALEKNEFSLYYQPLVSVANKQVTSLEALLRWNPDNKGFVPPMEFIPVAEEIGLIVPIGEWVLREACLQHLAWQQRGSCPLNLRVSINISARQVRENNLVERFAFILQETGMSGDFLTVELTESLIMQDIDKSARLIKEIKDLGVLISVDDFGTGYSSLSYLRRFPIDILKIDRSFITEISDNADDASIVTAIIAMAHTMKMKVVAEGVETAEQYYFLRDRECDEIQGYLISHPIPADGVEKFLNTPLDFLERDPPYLEGSTA